jgi:predicted ArsR family transcriptional regulator
MAGDTGGRSRDRLLFLLKTRGEQTAAQLARRLQITPVAVRQHLAALAGEGDVQHGEQRRGVGRPAHVWSLTEQASERFPDTHAELTVELLESLRESFGDAGVDRLLEVRRRRQLEAYRARMPDPAASIEKRVAALAALRRQEGYMAEWRRRGDGFLLVENHCPICAAARVCQGLCRDELRLFREVLGGGVQVERGEHLLAGARRCVYSIERVSEDSE